MLCKQATELNVPGVMLYLDMIPCLQQMTYTEKGKLLDAMLQYARCGEIPALTKRVAPVWEVLRARIDRDAERYADTIWQRRYAAYAREQRKKNLEVAPFEAWYAGVEKRYTVSEVTTGDGVTNEALMAIWQRRRAQSQGISGME